MQHLRGGGGGPRAPPPLSVLFPPFPKFDDSDMIVCASDETDATCNPTEYDRLEGTPGYMAPEALLFSSSSPSSSCSSLSPKVDAWSLGCLTHFLVHGSPLYFGDRVDVLAAIFEEDSSHSGHVRRRVRFDSLSSITTQQGSSEPAGHTTFINLLLEKSVEDRMSVSQALNHWFISTGSASSTTTAITEAKPKINPETVHISPSLVPELFSLNTASQGTAASAAGDDDWKRRQLSVLIAPLPDSSAYVQSSTGAAAGAMNRIGANGVSAYSLTVIQESQDERCSSFG